MSSFFLFGRNFQKIKGDKKKTKLFSIGICVYMCMNILGWRVTNDVNGIYTRENDAKVNEQVFENLGLVRKIFDFSRLF